MPCAHVYNGVFSADSRHDGHNHSNSISLRQLLDLLALTAAATTTAALTIAQRNASYSPHDVVEVEGRPAILLRCHRRDCNNPWATLVAGKIQILSWHGPHKHANELSLEVIRALTIGV